MKQKIKMTCPLTGGIIDSDLCYDVQECIEGDAPVSLELEEFLEHGDCESICHDCEYNVLSDKWTNNDPSASYEDEYETTNQDKDVYDLDDIVNALEKNKKSLEAILGSNYAAYEKMTTSWQKSEEGVKEEYLISVLRMSVKHLNDCISNINLYLKNDACDNANDDRPNEYENMVEDGAISFDNWLNNLQKNINTMVNTFRFIGLEKPKIICSSKNYEGTGDINTKVDIYIELVGIEGKIIKEDFVLKLNLYKLDGTLICAEEINIPAGSFKGYNTYLIQLEKSKKLMAASYGRLFISRF